jgi:TRAP-type C4-dicarboxylate transport system permease small subunit
VSVTHQTLAPPTGRDAGAPVARWLQRLEDWLAIGSAVAVFLIMLIVVADVALRYLMNAPLPWSFDLISIYLMGAAFFLALSQTLRLSHHVNVDLAYERFPLVVRRLLKLIGWGLAAALFGWIAWLAAATAFDRYTKGDVIVGAYTWPTWIPAAIAALGFGAMVVRLVLGVMVLAARLAGGRIDVEPYAGSDVGDRPPAGPGLDGGA